MAMQTGIGFSKILILVGAGYTGSIVLKNGRLSDLLADLQSLVKGMEKSEDPSKTDTDYSEAIAAQVRRLAMEVRQIASARQITVLNGNSSQIGNITSLAMPAAALGALGYGYMWWKGLSFSDLMYVTKRNMATAVSSMTKHLEQVSAALAIHGCPILVPEKYDVIFDSLESLTVVKLGMLVFSELNQCNQIVQAMPGRYGFRRRATKKHLTQRIENLDGKLDEQKEMSKLIKNEVTDVRADLSQIGYDLDSLQRMVSGLDGKICSLEDKQDLANVGVWYLCNFVDGKNVKMPEILQGQLKPPSRARGFLTFPETPVLKGLKEIADTLMSGKIDSSVTDTIMQNDTDKLDSHPRCLTRYGLAILFMLDYINVGQTPSIKS
ncbi:hypothetical protein HHK36_007199 [Tetracentron sinense]|uniref:DUF1664 domain-containing protein n=1 Tax=Tetracentron sinense TaxID=13715 RepID=A0A835DLD7_TETSI|nr:hypothetical protein HHK36_007199 [Tetracentron sinense]